MRSARLASHAAAQPMAGNESLPSGALSGIVVLDLSRVLAGPWCSQILGDLGAEVHKVEHPSHRDDTRGWGPPFVEDGSDRPDSAYYMCCNRNKRSLAVDFSHPDGAELLRRLAAQSDVVLENYRSGSLVKYGLDYATIHSLNPRAIYCSITGFGQTGPYAAQGAYDFLIQAVSGLMSITGTPEGLNASGPLKVGLPISDLLTGLYAAVSILAALHHRERTGEGQHIDCALLDSQIATLANQALNYLLGGKVPGRLGNAHPNVAPYRDFAASDQPIALACANDGQFQALCKVLERPDLGRDPRFLTSAGRNSHRAELESEIAPILRARPAAEWLSVLGAAAVPCGPINRIDQALSSPQVESRELIREVHREDGTAVPVIAFPARLSRTPATYREAPPRFAQDTHAVLRARLGMEESAMAELEARGIIASSRG